MKTTTNNFFTSHGILVLITSIVLSSLLLACNSTTTTTGGGDSNTPAASTESGFEFDTTLPTLLSPGGNTFHVYFQNTMTVVGTVPAANYEFYVKGTKIAVTSVVWTAVSQSIDITYAGAMQTLATGESAYVIIPVGALNNGSKTNAAKIIAVLTQ